MIIRRRWRVTQLDLLLHWHKCWCMKRKILVTGANRGIGLALCKFLVDAGHEVIAGARNPQAADCLVELSESGGKNLQVLQLDVDADESVERAVQAIGERHDHLDILVNNAGIFPEEGDEKIEELPLEWFERAFQTNVVGTIRVTRAMLPLLRLSTAAAVVNMGSGAGTISTKSDHRRYCYGASKAALHYVSRALAAELQPIIVTVISPGWVRTEMGGEDADLDVDQAASSLADTILSLKAEDSSQFLARDGSRDHYQW